MKLTVQTMCKVDKIIVGLLMLAHLLLWHKVNVMTDNYFEMKDSIQLLAKAIMELKYGR